MSNKKLYRKPGKWLKRQLKICIANAYKSIDVRFYIAKFSLESIREECEEVVINIYNTSSISSPPYTREEKSLNNFFGKEILRWRHG